MKEWREDLFVWRSLIMTSLIALPALSACGLQGNPVRPVPLWGNPPNEGPKDPRTLKAEKEKADADKARKKADEEADRAKRAAEQAAAAAPAPSTATPAPQ
jgi:hypothetical protein